MKNQRLLALLLMLSLLWTASLGLYALADEGGATEPEIQPIQTETASEPAPEPQKEREAAKDGEPAVVTWTVTFEYRNADDTTATANVTVEDGGTATAPTVTAITNAKYKFDQWDKPLGNIAGTQTIKALYHNPLTIVFKDSITGSDLKSEVVAYEEKATPPNLSASEHLHKPGDDYLQCTGWDKAYNSITSSDTILTTTKKVFQVVFKYEIGNTVVEKLVEDGTALPGTDWPNADADGEIKQTGYRWLGWFDESGTKVTPGVTIDSNRTFTGKYEPKQYLVTFYVKLDGTHSDKLGSVFVGRYASVKSGDYPATSGLPSYPGYVFTGNWKLDDGSAVPTSVTDDLNVYAIYRKDTNVTPTLGDYEVPSGKPKASIDLLLSIACTAKDRPNTAYFSNKLNPTYSYADPNSRQYDQAIVSDLGIKWLKLVMDVSDPDSLPFNTVGVAREAYVIDQAGVNQGFAKYVLTLKSKATNGTYPVKFKIIWEDAQGEFEIPEVIAYVKVTGAKSSSGSSSSGGFGSGSSSVEKPLPTTRFYIESVRTEPELPDAGEQFSVFLTLINRNPKLYLQNMVLTWSNPEDVLEPAGGNTNYVYIDRIDADSTLEVEIPVVSQKDVATEIIKMDVSIDYQDRKMADGSMAAQTVNLRVKPVLRAKIDELSLPTSNPIEGEDYEIKVNFANAGKTTIYNLAAVIVTEDENLQAGPEFYSGQVDSNTSKTLEVLCTPLTPGTFSGKVKITYEDENGTPEEVFRDFTFVATEEESYDFDAGMGDYTDTEPVVEAPTALSIMGMLPLWLYGAVGVLVLMIIVSMTVSARKRRRRAMEDDEME